MDTRSVLLQLLSLLCLVLSSVVAVGDYQSHIMILPQSPVVEIGKNFTATCALQNTSAATAEDLYWSFPKPLPKEQYTRINASAIAVTLTITSASDRWLMCNCRSSSPNVMMNKSRFMSGILFRKGYPPEKPEGLSCVALQSGDKISNVLRCSWEPGTRGSGELHTNYTLFARITPPDDYEPLSVVVKRNNSGNITLPEIFPHHMGLEIWVTAANDLGSVQSEHLEANANKFVKTNPPANSKVISEENFTTTLLISWTSPIAKAYVSHLIYHIRFCAAGSETWSEVSSEDIKLQNLTTDTGYTTQVPFEDTPRPIQSFRLQNLTPDTSYITQVRCRDDSEDNVYWSEWSRNATAKTPEDEPKTEPDVWRIITQTDSKNKVRTVQIICKDPRLSNGRIVGFNVSLQRREWERVNRSDGSITYLGQIHLTNREGATIQAVARNSKGTSPVTALIIPRTERQSVGELQSFTRGGQLVVEWQPPNATGRGAPLEYVVEWAWLSDRGTDWQMDWQREGPGTTSTAIRGALEKFIRYSVSVYPMYHSVYRSVHGLEAGKPATVAVYLEQGAPLEGPSVTVEAGRDEARLVWSEVPLSQRRGFITNYTIFYSAEDKKVYPPILLSPDTSSYTLEPLTGNTNYVVRIMASTIGGSCKGTPLSFSTFKYAPGQIEGIVVGVCIGFLFLVMLTMFLCIYKKDLIKKNFWPQIPDPGNSSIGAWSPDSPSKADTPKENAMADVSVVEVDAFDGKSVFEEDKAGLPLKKDKYLSEEHSSGIGGSSCMSSPRQSVSDSDEGGDSGQTTGSTVQYSSVVAAPSGYKGQTPGCQPQQQQHTFARSESTQPLLDSEENPEAEGGGGRAHRFPPCKPYFGRSPGGGDACDSTELSRLEAEEGEGEGGGAPARFCPLEEDSRQATPPEEGRSPSSSYRPQLSGYRPQ